LEFWVPYLDLYIMTKNLEQNNFTIGFYGGVGDVTGANFLIQIQNTKVLVDCGLIQGIQRDVDPNYEKFAYEPSEIKYLFITHAHMDHIGRIGKLIKDGFDGVIYSTLETFELSKLMLEDALAINQMQADRKKIKPLYSASHLEKAYSNWKSIKYQEIVDFEEFTVTSHNTGHILGSCVFVFTNKKTGKRLTATGDIGNSPNPLLQNADTNFETEFLITESVYGDREHEELENRKQILKHIISNIARRNGTILMPVFSLEKTQMLLTELNDLVEQNLIPQIPIFLDSPLAIRLTEIYKESTHLFNKEIQEQINSGDDIFDFPKLKFTYHKAESEQIDRVKGAKIIISASGISEGGRITAHEKKYLPNKDNALVLIGHQILGSLGRRILEGDKLVHIDGSDVPVNAEIIQVHGYSSHADSSQLLEYIERIEGKLEQVFVCMGEPKASFFLSQRIKDYLGVDAMVPNEGEIIEI
jgi:metallo-beta-lactamase family protein